MKVRSLPRVNWGLSSIGGGRDSQGSFFEMAEPFPAREGCEQPPPATRLGLKERYSQATTVGFTGRLPKLGGGLAKAGEKSACALFLP